MKPNSFSTFRSLTIAISVNGDRNFRLTGVNRSNSVATRNRPH
jgi:hypothetical protein